MKLTTVRRRATAPVFVALSFAFLVTGVFTLSLASATPSSSSPSITPFNHVGLSAPVAISAHGKYLWVVGATTGSLLRINRTTLSATTLTSPLFTKPQPLPLILTIYGW